MNLLEHYIKKVHSIEEWKENPEYIIVTVTYVCYGVVGKTKHFTTKEQWKMEKEQGFFLA